VNVAASVEQGRRRHPERPALLFEGAAISYARLDALANGEAARLRAAGLGRGDRVALCLPNTPQFVASYLGALKLGCIVVSVNPGLTEEERHFILRDSGAAHVITDADAWREASLRAPDTVALEMAPDDPAAIVYTSGTTGFPKGATLSHGNVVFAMEAKRRYMGIRPEDRLILFLPLFHCFGQNAILNAGLCAGATLVLQRSFDKDRALDAIAREGVTMVCAVPTNFIVLHGAASASQMRGVRYWLSGGAPLPLEVELRWREKFGQPINQGYGSTETSPFASYNHETEYRPGSIGSPIEGVQMAVADVEDGRFLAPGEAGEIVVKGPNVMLGYWNRPEETREAIRGGWFHTGDIGRVDAEGYFRIEDRLKDMAIVGGYNVYPTEVENALYRHPAVAEAAAYGVPDPVLGERVRVAVALKPGCAATEAELLGCCRGHLAEYKLPTAIDVVDALPKCRAGKIRKRILRDEYRAAQSAPPAPAEQTVRDAAELERRIAGWMAGQLQVPPREINAERSFADYGFTSLAAVQLVERLARLLGRAVSPTVPWHYSTPRSLARHLLPGSIPAAAGTLAELSVEIARMSEEQAERQLLAELDAAPKMRV
jgi:long-chain acyl-CoA synthetase